EYQFSGINRDWELEGQKLIGSIGSLRPEGAEVLATFSNDKPAITEYQLGKGTAVILGYEAARSCFRPGNEEMEEMMLKYTLGEMQQPFHAEDAIVYRLAGPEADHYFLLNEGEEKEVDLTFDYYQYSSASDAVSGENLPLDQKISLPAHGARWVRYKK
ncbi:MAG: hypothetical protein ACLFT3_14105, partial [Cyclobacteriaceae bacterium]